MMKYQYTFNLRGVKVELQGEDHEEVKEGVQESIEFVEDHGELFEDVSNAAVVTGSHPNPAEATRESIATEEGELGDISEHTQVDPDILSQLIAIPDSPEDPPNLKLYQFDDGPEILDTSRKGRQAKASLILLYVWEEALGVEEVEGEFLDEALHDSEIDSERRDAMYSALGGDADNYFNRGQGIVSLRPPGRQAARDEIRRLATEIQS